MPAHLQFDSWGQRPAPGLRSDVAERQWLYALGDFALDLQVNSSAQAGAVDLRGQLIAQHSQSVELAGVTVQLNRMGVHMRRCLTDELGRFAMSGLLPGTYDLQLMLDRYQFLIENLDLTGA